MCSIEVDRRMGESLYIEKSGPALYFVSQNVTMENSLLKKLIRHLRHQFQCRK